MCSGKSIIAAQKSVHRWTPFWIWMQSATKMEADTPLFFFIIILLKGSGLCGWQVHTLCKLGTCAKQRGHWLQCGEIRLAI